MSVEYYIQEPIEYSHEKEALVRLAHMMRYTFSASEQTYLLAANVHFAKTQADALVFTPHAIILIELKSCSEPIQGDATTPWQILSSSTPIYGGNHLNPYQQVTATRRTLIKYLDEHSHLFLDRARAKETAKSWGHVSAAITFAPFLHPDSKVTVPPASRVWARVLGLNEMADFLFSRVSNRIDLRPMEMRCLAETFSCKHWKEIEGLFPPKLSPGHLWLLDEEGRRTYAFPLVDAATIGRSRDNSCVVPRQFERTSRHHAYIRLVGDVAWVFNDNSHGEHDTFINNETLLPGQGRPLQHGDRIMLGSAQAPEICCLEFDNRPHLDDTTSNTALPTKN